MRIYGPNEHSRVCSLYIPSDVRKELGINDGDLFVWKIEQRGNKKVAVFEKVADLNTVIEIVTEEYTKGGKL